MLLANNTGGGFYARGSESFVASAAAGAAIGNAIKAANNFDACMMANGWEIADEAHAPAPTSYTSSNFTNTAPSTNPTAVAPTPTPQYSGDMKNGMKDGRGTATYADGSRYVGEFKNDVRSGYGVWTNKNGERYEGQWANDRRNGPGTLTGTTGILSQGIWQDGEFIKRQALETASTVPAPVPTTFNAGFNDGHASPLSPRPLPSNVAAPRPKSSKSAGRKSISPTAAALSAANPQGMAPTNPSSATVTTVSASPSSMSVTTCTHEQQVQARIAKMNGYTAGPKCD